MQHVKPQWLKWISWLFAGLDILLIAGYAYFASGAGSDSANEFWGITSAVVIFASIHLVYVLTLRRYLEKRNPWLGALISFIMTGLLMAMLIETSGQSNVYYRIILALVVFLSAANGIMVTATALSLIWLLFIFTITAIVQPSKTPTDVYFLIDLGHTVAGFFGWLTFKRFYLASNTEEVTELSTKLEEEQFKTSAILESITDGVLVINMKNIIQIANVSAAQMLGWTKDEVTNLDFHSLIKPLSDKPDEETKETEAISQTLKSGEPSQKVSKLETLNGHQIYVDIVASPIMQNVTNKDGKKEQRLSGVIAVLRDVDKQKRSEQQRSDFISTASHEMRTPVASIQGYLELALNPKISNLDEKTKSYLDKAYDATKHLGQLFQDLLTVSQTEDGRISSHPTAVDVNKLLTSMCDNFKQSAVKKGLTMQCNLHENETGDKNVEPLMYVKADAERLREVISNLVENAIKYTPQGTVTINANIKDDAVQISVADTGPGIPEEDLPHLFQKFYRVDNSQTREIGGTGLGLYISKQIVELFDGKIWVESKFGQGSTFIIELPRTNPGEIDRPPTPQTPQVQNTPSPPQATTSQAV